MGDTKRFLVVALSAGLFLGTSPEAQVIRPLTESTIAWDASSFVIDDAGSVAFAVTNNNPFGADPLAAPQIVRWTVPGGAPALVGQFRRGAQDVSVSDDGLWLTVVSTSDPLGQNHDLSPELFLMSSDATTIVQLTSDPAFGAGLVKGAVISGSGNRVLFQADTDPLGSNPGRYDQLFVVDTDGNNLTQLTAVAADGEATYEYSISDDGARVAYESNGNPLGTNADGTTEIFTINANGSGLRQKTASTTLHSFRPRISGDGTKIVVMRSADAYADTAEVWVVNWLGTGSTQLTTSGRLGSISADGSTVYYAAGDADNGEIFKVDTATPSPIQLTFTAAPLDNSAPRVFDSNSQVAFVARGGAHPGGSNPDGGVELVVMDADGSNVQQVTEIAPGAFDGRIDLNPNVTPDGQRTVFKSWEYGIVGASDIYRVQADGSDLTRVTTNADPADLSQSSDGGMVAFSSDEDLAGQSCNPAYFQAFRIQADGTGLLLASPPCVFLRYARIDGNGSFVVYQDDSGLVRIPSAGGPVGQIFADAGPGSLLMVPYLSNDAQWVAFNTNSDFDGLNPNGWIQVLRARTDGSLVERVTLLGGFWPDIDADGDRVAYTSDGDPLGTNPDGNLEIFLFDASTSTTLQLTDTTDGDSTEPRISGDGEFVYFVSSATFVEALPKERFDLYRVTVSTGLIERASGLRDLRTEVQQAGAFAYRPQYSVTHDGRAVISGELIATHANFDLNHQLWFIDFDALAGVQPSKAAPTVVTWDVEPAPLRYDVIRGDVANLQFGPPGEVDLGAVVCIEDDSADSDTVGFEDATQPAPGQVLFYVHRGSRGALVGPGSYGQAHDGSERVPASGNCQP